MLRIIEPRCFDVVSVAEAKEHLRIEHDDDDHYLKGLIAAATTWVENYLQRTLIKQKYYYIWRPDKEDSSSVYHIIRLPMPPIVAVEEVYDISEDQKRKIRRVSFDIESDRPVVMVSKDYRKIEVTYWAGYGETAASVPPVIRQAILMGIESFYEREDKSLDQTPLRDLLTSYKTIEVV